ncbi:hypothetical protein ASG43_18480 [Aureimonas sp. Leaf454]|uniref:hypothetical protein n=1 Tax=Aureimonas sp. Leaf454 TaxID=1736381 RepID=UPI0006F6CE28|nr:hypothetical protein [Aureimonas sp. Leaf454]KQT53213.1 hypothetical protein ASG43_18480 [Aureimonas sp. Leaf454]
MKYDLLHALFHDLDDVGSIRIKKSKLLWMLGRQLETPSVWNMLMRQWRAAGYDGPLYGLHWGDEVTLTTAPTQVIAADWATRREPASASSQKQLTLVS